MAFDTIHGGLGKKWREWKTEIEIFSIFLYKNKKFYHKKRLLMHDMGVFCMTNE